MHKCLCFLLVLCFGMMSFALPGNHFSSKAVTGIDYLSLEPDASVLSGYSTDGYLLGYLLDMLTGGQSDASGDDAPVKNFNFHYSYFNIHKAQADSQDKKLHSAHKPPYTFAPAVTTASNSAATGCTPYKQLLPSYYNFLFRLTPF